MPKSVIRPLAGLVTVVAIAAVILVALGLFRGSFTDSVPVTVVSQRAGLVMDPDAKVKIRGVQVGKVDSIESRPDGQAALHLAMNPAELKLIPGNVRVDIASSTVFGAKFVELVPPPDVASGPNGLPKNALRAGQILPVGSVTVEINTVFEQLTSLLSKIDPVKLNQTLGAISSALNGRGEKLGQTVSDFDNLLKKIDPSLQNISRDLELAPPALNAYADAAPDLVGILDNTTALSNTLVDQEENLDTFLISAIGLADTGNQVVGDNRQALTDVLGLLVPTTDLLNKYNDGLRCGIGGLIPFLHNPPLQEPGVAVSASLTFGVERYRYPHDLPKVAATGGPHCADEMLPQVPMGKAPPFLVTDIGANPWEYGNQGLLANSDGLKEALFGPLDGPPRNSAQIGQPG